MKVWHAIYLASACCIAGGSSRRLLLHDVPTVGIGSLVRIGSTRIGSPTSASSKPLISRAGSTSGTDLEGDLIQALEVDQQVTVIAPVELGQLLCDTLADAEDALALSFDVHENETVIAKQIAYSTTDGNAFTDGIGRKVWTGVVVYPAQTEDEVVPRTVSMTWGEVCDTETFLLKVTKRNIDATTTIVKTIPCDDSATHTCLVEVLVEFEEPGDVLIPDEALLLDKTTSSQNDVGSTTEASQGGSRRLEDVEPIAAPSPEERRRQLITDTVIDVMVLYSEQAMTSLGGISPEQMETTISESLVWTNQAFVNSEVPVYFATVHVGLLPYEEDSLDGVEMLTTLRSNEDVATLRDSTGADLVQMVGYFDDGFCGWGYTLFSEANGFSLVKASCLDNYANTHEFGHNFGCQHNRESTSIETDYAHGFRYCDGDDPYRTIMSYSCGVAYGNYFSNPNVTYLGKPTGTATDDNARAIEDNVVAVSSFRAGPTTTPPTPAPVFTFFAVGPTPPPTPAPVIIRPHTSAPSASPSPTHSAPVSTVSPTLLLLATNSPTTPPPANYTYIGCYGDSVLDRVLSGDFQKGDGAMTTQVCAALCEGSPYFGTEFSVECFCGATPDDPTELGKTTCTFECAGNASEICGGPDALSVYQYPDAVGVAVPTPQYMGCWGDSKRGRIMGTVETESSMTKDYCEALCNGYAFFGLQYGEECWCGDASTDFTIYGKFTKCHMACAGDDETLCGGYYAMAVWGYQTVDN